MRIDQEQPAGNASELGKTLHPRAQAFVREYVRDLNGTQAAIRAGYSDKSAASTASRLLRQPEVQAYRDALIREAFEAIGISEHFIAAEIWEIYQKCTQKEPVLEWDRESRSWVPTGEWAFNVRGALKALEMLLRMMPSGKMPDDEDGRGVIEMPWVPTGE